MVWLKHAYGQSVVSSCSFNHASRIQHHASGFKGHAYDDVQAIGYVAGIDVTNGLVAGLLSKEQELVNAATKLADAFTAEFNAKMSTALPMPTAPTAPVLSLPEMPQTMGIRLGDIKLGNFGATAAESALAAKLIASPKATAWTTTINVNAGVGTNGKAVGQAIYSELLSFAKANGIKI